MTGFHHILRITGETLALIVEAFSQRRASPFELAEAIFKLGKPTDGAMTIVNFCSGLVCVEHRARHR